MSQTLFLNPGEVSTGTITIINPSNSTEDFAYQLSAVPYNVSGEDYEIDTTSVETHSQISEWIALPESTGVLKPGESKQINFSITVPTNAPGGGQTAAIIVAENQSNSANSGIGVDSTFSMGSVVYANVAGETEHSGEILSNTVPNFTISTPVNVGALLSNSGNVYETASITISVTNNLTGEKILSSESDGGNSFSEIILPETTRRVSRQVDNLPAVGVVHIEQNVIFEGETSTVSQELFICPVWFMALMAFILVSIISGIIVFVHKRRQKRASL